MPLPERTDPVWQTIAARISEHIGRTFTVQDITALAGGCINSAARIADGQQRFFVKFNEAGTLPMFEAEAEGLEALTASKTLRVPAPLCAGRHSGHAWLVLEYLDSLGNHANNDWHALGDGLAQMHRARQPFFGWHRDNTIGSTPQINRRSDNWIEFLRHYRLGYQLALAEKNGFRGRLQSDGKKLLEQMGAFFEAYTPQPSLLHGDLWSGNAAFLDSGEPVIFDPASYYGDREADIAMTELFGGFSAQFYHSYEAAWPLDPGYDSRKHLYNLYHLLNHLNLFGHGYLSQCEATIRQLLARIH